MTSRKLAGPMTSDGSRSIERSLVYGEGSSLSRAEERQSRREAWRTALAACLVGAAGLAIAHAATDGFSAFTLESARRLAATRTPLPVPDFSLDLTDGGRTQFGALPGRVLLVDFIYTGCPTLCTTLGSVYARLQDRLRSEIAAGEVRLLSISFDPMRDGPGELRAYRARFTRDPAGWMLGRPGEAGDLARWLDAFGVVVIPDGLGGYVHNAAVHVVGEDRRVRAILDLDDTDRIVAAVRTALGRNPGHVAFR